MRKLTLYLLILPLVALGVFACDGSVNPAGPGEADEALPAGAAGGGDGSAAPMSARRQMVPFKDDAWFAPIPSAGFTSCTVPSGFEPIAFPAANAGVGQSSHMGRTEIYISLDYCVLTPTGILGGGEFIDTAANGDQVWGVWDARFTSPTTFEFVAVGKSHPLVITGGSGRFAGVTGYAYGTGGSDPSTGLGTYFVYGAMRSVGSLK
jgi:hypothetical protein